MTNRRDFLKNVAAAGGVAFASCGILEQRARAQQKAAAGAAPKRREAKVGGKRVKTIDMHAHVIVPEAMTMVGRKIEPENENIITGKMAEAQIGRAHV